MKFSRKKVFQPVTITIEDKREAGELLSALQLVEAEFIKKGNGYSDLVPKTVAMLISQLQYELKEDKDE